MTAHAPAKSYVDSLADWQLRRFDGKVAVVTGGASGIGRATAERLAAEGARVYIADRRPLAPDDPVAESVASIPVDVTDEASVADCIARVVADAGPVDVLVNGAGVVYAGGADDTPLDKWQLLLSVNLTGAFLMSRAVLPAMMARRSGAIVSVGSDAGLVGQVGQAAYCASKGGLVHFTKAAALDAAGSGVRVNCVCPCFVDTPLLAAWVEAQEDPAAARAAADAEQPIGRVGRAEEIASAIAWLASDESSFVTGIALAVDGGTTAR